MNQKTMFKDWHWIFFLILLVIVYPYSRPALGKAMASKTSLVAVVQSIGDHLLAACRAFATMADARPVLAAEKTTSGDDNTNDNGADDNKNGNDGGDENQNDNDNDNDNDNGDDDGNDNGDDDGNDNGDDDGNDNGDDDGNDNGDDDGNDNGDDNGNEGDVPVVEGEVVVELMPGADAEAIAGRYDLSVLENLVGTDIYRMGYPSGRILEEVLSELGTDPEVRNREAHYLLEQPEINPRSVVFIDPRSVVFIDGQSPSEYFDQWALDRIEAEKAQTLSKGEGVTVAVIDTGIDLDHPVFNERKRLLNRGRAPDYIDGDNNPCEGCSLRDASEGIGFGHGTFVAGIIALAAPEAMIVPIRAFNAQGQGKAFDIAKAIRYASGSRFRRSVDIINMSFGLQTSSFVIDAAITVAAEKGVVLVASAGNKASVNGQYPARNDAHVIAVAATDQNDVKAEFSNFGGYVDVSAPGVEIYSAYPRDTQGQFRFAGWNGTSFAAPFVSAEAALVYAVAGEPTRTPDMVRKVIEESSVNIDAQNQPDFAGLLGHGRIEAFAAVSESQDP